MQKNRNIPLSKYFPEVQEFSHSKTNSAKPFIPTFEDKTWTSILYIERGNFQIRYETGEILRAKGGTFYYHPPLSLKYQTSDKLITPYSMYHLAVDLSLTNLSLFSSHPADQQIIKQFPNRPFVRNAPPLLISSFKIVFEEYTEKQSGYLVQIENSIRQIMISAIRSAMEQEQHQVTSEKFMAKVDAFLAENKTFMGPVELLFERMGVSRSHGYDIFHQTFGINPKEYILRKKIIYAKQMLLDGNAITTIAFDLGFSSSQSFATTFKKLTCSTPSNFRKNSLK
jgi:AraC-like DNA-binding protein